MLHEIECDVHDRCCCGLPCELRGGVCFAQVLTRHHLQCWT